MKSKAANRLTREDSDDPHHQLFAAIALIKTPEEAKEFFTDLCTPAELQAMADRWLVVEPIIAGQAYRKIYDLTGVSATTIGRVARCISHGCGGYNKIFKRFSQSFRNKQNVTATKIKNSNSKEGEVKH